MEHSYKGAVWRLYTIAQAMWVDWRVKRATSVSHVDMWISSVDKVATSGCWTFPSPDARRSTWLTRAGMSDIEVARPGHTRLLLLFLRIHSRMFHVKRASADSPCGLVLRRLAADTSAQLRAAGPPA